MCRDDGGSIDAFIRNDPCAFIYIIYPIFVQRYVMGRFGHENGPFWMLAGAVLVLFFLPLGPFWRWAVLVGSRWQHGKGVDGCYSYEGGSVMIIIIMNLMLKTPKFPK